MVTRASAAVAVVFVLAGCSGDGGAAELRSPTAAAPATTSTSGMTASSVTTSATSATSNATGHAGRTVAPTTDAPPPASAAVPIDEVRAAYQRTYDGYWSCLRRPLDCDTSWLVPRGPAAAAMESTMRALADRARFVGDDDVGYHVIEQIDVDPDGERVEITACWWSTAVLHGAPANPTRPAGPDNPPTVVNDTHVSARQLDELRLVDGSWALWATHPLGDHPETNTCLPDLSR